MPINRILSFSLLYSLNLTSFTHAMTEEDIASTKSPPPASPALPLVPKNQPLHDQDLGEIRARYEFACEHLDERSMRKLKSFYEFTSEQVLEGFRMSPTGQSTIEDVTITGTVFPTPMSLTDGLELLYSQKAGGLSIEPTSTRFSEGDLEVGDSLSFADYPTETSNLKEALDLATDISNQSLQMIDFYDLRITEIRREVNLNKKREMHANFFG